VEELVFLVEEAPEGGYTARALGESIFTEADDLESLRDMVRDAVRCHYDEGERSTELRVVLLQPPADQSFKVVNFRD
jgi:dephospho-CoA kinase